MERLLRSASEAWLPLLLILSALRGGDRSPPLQLLSVVAIAATTRALAVLPSVAGGDTRTH